jgi:hypothetical protein
MTRKDARTGVQEIGATWLESGRLGAAVLRAYNDCSRLKG